MLDSQESYFKPMDLSTLDADAETKIFEGLNPPQVEAVNCLEGPLLVMAGAGSGKTKVLTCRIANLLAHNIPPWQILAITFTNKAANEMKSRAEKMIGEPARQVWLSTFHSFCARVLRQEIEILGTYKKAFTIYDAGDSLMVLRDCVKKLNLDEERFSGMLGRISKAKNLLLDAAHYRQSINEKPETNEYDRDTANIYEIYEKKLIENNALDFDDLIMIMVKILRKYPDILNKYQDHFRYILIDEYQDTNVAQYELTKLLADKYRNICVVGDADQSIYGWRGADMQNILNFKNDYPDAKVVVLEQNYRSTKQILTAANSLIRNNKTRLEKNLWTLNETGDKINFVHCLSDRSEAAYVSREIKRLITYENVQYKDIAVLYRINAQSRIIEERFIQVEIPHIIIGGLKFYDRKEIKDTLAYLRLIYNPNDNVSLQRIINAPRRGIGTTSMSRLSDFADASGASIFSTIANNANLIQVPQLYPAVRQKFREFAAMMTALINMRDKLSVAELTRAVLEESGYMSALRDGEEGEKAENIARVENLSALVNSAEEFTAENPGSTLEDFLNHVSLVTDADVTDEDESKVSLMTIHAAKGLEFPIVFLIGMEEGILPNVNALMSFADLEEERRACYVAMTRAKEKLYITASGERKTFGKVYKTKISRFMGEIPLECLTSVSEHSSGGNTYNKTYAQGVSVKTSSANVVSKTPPIITAIKKPEPNPQVEWHTGDRLQHRKWGLGTVMAVNGANITIAFANPEVGEKVLRATIAPIEKV